MPAVLFSFGSGSLGELGTGTRAEDAKRPSAAPVLFPQDAPRDDATGEPVVEAVALGTDHSLALLDGRPYRWGLLGAHASPAPRSARRAASGAPLGTPRGGCDSADGGCVVPQPQPLWCGGRQPVASGRDAAPDARIRSVACGGSNSFMVTLSGEAFLFGGLWPPGGDPARVRHLWGAARGGPPSRVARIAAGWRHCLLLTEAGCVFAIGDDEHGQCAGVNGGAVAVALPTSQAAVGIAAGACHSVAWDRAGQAFAWGHGGSGRLGLGGTQHRRAPVRVEALCEPVCGAACGANFTVFATTAGRALWVCGGNQYGQLGLGSVGRNSQREVPAPLSGLPGEEDEVVGLECGANHALCLTRPRSPAAGSAPRRPTVWAWGCAASGQCGRAVGEALDAPPPECRASPAVLADFAHPSGLWAVAVAAGRSHSAVLAHVLDPSTFVEGSDGGAGRVAGAAAAPTGNGEQDRCDAGRSSSGLNGVPSSGSLAGPKRASEGADEDFIIDEFLGGLFGASAQTPRGSGRPAAVVRAAALLELGEAALWCDDSGGGGAVVGLPSVEPITTAGGVPDAIDSLKPVRSSSASPGTATTPTRTGGTSVANGKGRRLGAGNALSATSRNARSMTPRRAGPGGQVHSSSPAAASSGKKSGAAAGNSPWPPSPLLSRIGAARGGPHANCMASPPAKQPLQSSFGPTHWDALFGNSLQNASMCSGSAIASPRTTALPSPGRAGLAPVMATTPAFTEASSAFPGSLAEKFYMGETNAPLDQEWDGVHDALRGLDSLITNLATGPRPPSPPTVNTFKDDISSAIQNKGSYRNAFAAAGLGDRPVASLGAAGVTSEKAVGRSHYLDSGAAQRSGNHVVGPQPVQKDRGWASRDFVEDYHDHDYDDYYDDDDDSGNEQLNFDSHVGEDDSGLRKRPVARGSPRRSRSHRRHRQRSPRASGTIAGGPGTSPTAAAFIFGNALGMGSSPAPSALSAEATSLSPPSRFPPWTPDETSVVSHAMGDDSATDGPAFGAPAFGNGAAANSHHGRLQFPEPFPEPNNELANEVDGQRQQQPPPHPKPPQSQDQTHPEAQIHRRQQNEAQQQQQAQPQQQHKHHEHQSDANRAGDALAEPESSPTAPTFGQREGQRQAVEALTPQPVSKDVTEPHRESLADRVAQEQRLQQRVESPRQLPAASQGGTTNETNAAVGANAPQRSTASQVAAHKAAARPKVQVVADEDSPSSASASDDDTPTYTPTLLAAKAASTSAATPAAKAAPTSTATPAAKPGPVPAATTAAKAASTSAVTPEVKAAPTSAATTAAKAAPSPAVAPAAKTAPTQAAALEARRTSNATTAAAPKRPGAKAMLADQSSSSESESSQDDEASPQHVPKFRGDIVGAKESGPSVVADNARGGSGRSRDARPPEDDVGDVNNILEAIAGSASSTSSSEDDD